MSCNIRGLGYEKWEFVKDIVRKEELDMVCVQETKTDLIDPNRCRGLWDSNMLDWVSTIQENRAGGIITI